MKNQIEKQKELVNDFIVENSKQSGKNAIEKLIFSDQKNDKVKFNNLLKLGIELKKSVDWFENIGSLQFKEKTGLKLPKSEFFELFFGLKKAWCYRLISTTKIEPEKISNYIESDKNPTIDKLLQFINPEKKQPEKSELTISFNQKKLQIRKGAIKSNLSLSELNLLINELKKIADSMQ